MADEEGIRRKHFQEKHFYKRQKYKKTDVGGFSCKIICAASCARGG
jgi:isopentenyldiphosphate isomerase